MVIVFSVTTSYAQSFHFFIFLEKYLRLSIVDLGLEGNTDC